MGWIVREYRKGDEKGICALLGEAFNTDFTLAEWRWKYQGAYLPNPAWIDVGVEEEDGSIIGHYVSLPRILRIRDSEYLVAMPCDYAVSAKYRRSLKKKGVAVAVFQRQIELQKVVPEKVYLGFGYVNKVHYRIGKRLLNYQDLCVIHTLEHSIFRIPKALEKVQVKFVRGLLWRFFLFRKLFSMNRRLKREGRTLEVTKIDRFEHGIDTFYRKFARLYPVGIKMDLNFLKGRFCDRPGIDYGIFTCRVNGEIAGYSICRVMDDTGIIIDLVSLNDPHITRVLLIRSLCYFLEQRVTVVRGLFLPGSFLYEELINYGFHWTREITNVVYWIFHGEEIDESVFTDMKNWHITYATFDDM
jgi:hypothetical protein